MKIVKLCLSLASLFAFLTGTAQAESDEMSGISRLEVLAARDSTITDPKEQAQAWLVEFTASQCLNRIDELREFLGPDKSQWEAKSAEINKNVDKKNKIDRCINLRSALSYYDKTGKIE